MPLNEINGFRETVFELETVRSYALVRHPWVHTRKASHIARLNTGRYGASLGMRLIPGECWLLNPAGTFTALFTHTDYAPGVIGAAGANLGVGIREVKEFKKPDTTDFPGIVTDPDVVASGMETFVKEITAGLNWISARLAADEAAFPKPALDTEFVQVDRVLSGKVTYPPNTPFAVMLRPPENTPDNLCTFYFGGPTGAVNGFGAGMPAGMFAANIRASGEVVLYEAEPGAAVAWPERGRFQLGPHGLAPHHLHAYFFLPFSRNRLAIIGPSAETAQFQTGFTGRPVAMSQRANRITALYRDEGIGAGHEHLEALTGAGPVRMDRAQHDRTGFRIARCFFAAAGTLADLPFKIDTPVKGGMKLRLAVDAEVPPGTGISWTVYNSQTGIALAESPPGEWALWPGQQSYHVVFSFVSDRTATPILRGYEVSVDAVSTTATPVVVKLQPDTYEQVTITGASTDPATATAHCVIEDRADPGNPTGGTGGILRRRARIPCRIKTRYDADGNHWSTLFEGETSPEGTESFLTALPDGTRYYRHDVACGPAWNRVLEALNMNGKRFLEDPAAPRGPFGIRPPWKVTDIIRYCFLAAGTDPNELDIPDIDFRLWLGPGATTDDFLLLPQQKFAPVILRYARDYLGGYIVRDSNAGTPDVNGNAALWRLLFRPAPPYTPLLEFRFGPDVSGGLVHAPEAYTTTHGVPRTWIQEGTYRESVRAPEFNYILVVGCGGALSNGAGVIGVHASLWNPQSYTLDPANPTATDPTHPDYIGHEIPALYVDMTLRTQEAVDYTCRRFYDRGAHGERSRSFRSPAYLVTDPNDTRQVRPRPLRTGDVVTVPLNDTGSEYGPAVVRSVRLDIPDGDLGGHWYDVDCVIAEDGGVGAAAGALLRPPLWEREKLRMAKLAAARLGLNVDIQRIYVSEITTIDQAIELLTLPTDPDNDHPLQDPTTGELYAVAGISDPFGSDLLL